MLSSIPDHPFIIKYYETLLYHNLIMIAMELIEGEDLFDSLSAKLPLKLEEIIFFAAQLVLIMEFLHENHIVYRDLKPENVMLNLDGYLTLIDFGTTKKLTI
jgi:serine/threonine protein kinase